MWKRTRPVPSARRAAMTLGGVLLIVAAGGCTGESAPNPTPGAGAQTAPAEDGRRTVRGVMQPRPGMPAREVSVGVHESPVDLPSVPASKAGLEEKELVLGVLLDGEAMAYPIRYLALYEVVDHRVGKVPVAPSW